MFNYIKDMIINDVEKMVVKDTETGTLVIKRGANYKCENIIDKKVFKSKGNEGKVATIEIPFVATDATYDYFQFAIFVSTPKMQLSDYALANWHEFGKPVLLESGAEDVDGLAEAFKLMLQPDNEMYKVEVSGGNVKLTFAEPWMHVAEVKVFKHNVETDVMEDDDRTVTIEQNEEEFATAKWLVENLRFPSYPNLRYNRLYADEAPVAGRVYTQYSFMYGVKHYIEGGLSGVGQNVDSITTHVFYVPSDQEEKFQACFTGIEFPEHTFDPHEHEVSTLDICDNE